MTLSVQCMKMEKYNLNGTLTIIPIAESYKDCVSLIKSDHYRITGKTSTFVKIVVKTFRPFESSLLFWLRLSQYKGWLYPLCRIMYERARRKSNVDIHPSTKIGYGFYLGHGICIVVNARTVIGNNVNLSQFVNIGSNHETPAIIGDNVYIGPHVCIVENVKIGNNSSIGAGAVVTKDVPENATVAGVPAKVLNYNNPSRYIQCRYPVA